MYYGLLYHSDHKRLKSLSKSMILVYTTLISHGGKDRTFTGSQSKLATISGVSLGSVKRALKFFENQNWLTSSDYYQIKRYVLTIDQSLEPAIVHSLEPPTIKKVDHSLDPSIVQMDDLPIDQNCDPHVLKNNKELIQLHDMTKEQKQFINFVERWQRLNEWSDDVPLDAYTVLCEQTNKVDHFTELQIVDSWLMLQHHNETGRCWKHGWFDRLQSWFIREQKQGGRKGLNLNKSQRYFLNFSVTDSHTDDPPIFTEQEEQPHLVLVEEPPVDVDDMIEQAKHNPTLYAILQSQGLL